MVVTGGYDRAITVWLTRYNAEQLRHVLSTIVRLAARTRRVAACTSTRSACASRPALRRLALVARLTSHKVVCLGVYTLQANRRQRFYHYIRCDLSLAAHGRLLVVALS